MGTEWTEGTSWSAVHSIWRSHRRWHGDNWAIGCRATAPITSRSARTSPCTVLSPETPRVSTASTWTPCRRRTRCARRRGSRRTSTRCSLGRTCTAGASSARRRGAASLIVSIRLSRSIGASVVPISALTTLRRTWLWSCTMLSSRAFPSHLIDGDRANATPILFPGVDTLNHRRGEKVGWVSSDKALALVTDVALESGRELFNKCVLVAPNIVTHQLRCQVERRVAVRCVLRVSRHAFVGWAPCLHDVSC